MEEKREKEKQFSKRNGSEKSLIRKKVKEQNIKDKKHPPQKQQ